MSDRSLMGNESDAESTRKLQELHVAAAELQSVDPSRPVFVRRSALYFAMPHGKAVQLNSKWIKKVAAKPSS